MVKFWLCLLEAGQIRLRDTKAGLWQKHVGCLAEVWKIRFGRWWADELYFWRWTFNDWVGYWRILFGRRRKASHEFTWWTYWVAVRRSLRLSRHAKRLWGRGYIAADVCCLTYARYEGVQKRARDKGYIKLASENIHDRWRWNTYFGF